VPTPDTLTLLALAAMFAAINGINDGSTLVANGLKVNSLRPLTAALLVLAGLAFVPLLFGTGVATTLVGRLVVFDGPLGRWPVAAAILSATVVTLLLTRRGLPTSLTLGLIGGITGAGLGAGLPVAWRMVAIVLVLAALAPLVGAGLAYVISGLPTPLPRRTSGRRVVGNAHRVGFVLQCLAYGANDGQKILAVFAIALGQTSGRVEASAGLLLVIALLFMVGMVTGLPRIASTISSGVITSRPYDAAVAGFSSAAAVLGTAAVGMPVSMTQAITGALVGVGRRTGAGRIRWQVVGRIAVAWTLTLPLAAVVAWLPAAAMRVVMT
jgi:inorganic phosphate transporter, PiT family